ncbi:MAG: EAL domain-containing protein [Pseudomonadota bacterium]
MGAHAVRLSNVDIDTALQNGDFEVLFQPIFDLGNGALARMESFVRWRHPTLGLLPPGAFISFFETQGRMSELTRYVFNQALNAYEEWRGPYAPGFSINLALSDLSDEAFANHFILVTRERGFPPEFITLECPMPPVDMDEEAAKKCFDRLAGTGARLAIEVRGRANEFLRTVSPFPFTEIKTGGAAILRFARTVRGPGLSAISELLELARAQNATISAVGVEDQVSLTALRSLGFAAAQGNHLGKVGDLTRFTPARVNVVRKLIGLPPLTKEALADLFRTGDPLNRRPAHADTDTTLSPSADTALAADHAAAERDETTPSESDAPTAQSLNAPEPNTGASASSAEETDVRKAPLASGATRLRDDVNLPTDQDTKAKGGSDQQADDEALVERLSARIAREMQDGETPARRRKARVRRKASSKPTPMRQATAAAGRSSLAPTGVLREASHDAAETTFGPAIADPAVSAAAVPSAPVPPTPALIQQRLRQELNVVTSKNDDPRNAEGQDSSALAPKILADDARSHETLIDDAPMLGAPTLGAHEESVEAQADIEAQSEDIVDPDAPTNDSDRSSDIDDDAPPGDTPFSMFDVEDAESGDDEGIAASTETAPEEKDAKATTSSVSLSDKQSGEGARAPSLVERAMAAEQLKPTRGASSPPSAPSSSPQSARPSAPSSTGSLAAAALTHPAVNAIEDAVEEAVEHDADAAGAIERETAALEPAPDLDSQETANEQASSQDAEPAVTDSPPPLRDPETFVEVEIDEKTGADNDTSRSEKSGSETPVRDEPASAEQDSQEFIDPGLVVESGAQETPPNEDAADQIAASLDDRAADQPNQTNVEGAIVGAVTMSAGELSSPNEEDDAAVFAPQKMSITGATARFKFGIRVLMPMHEPRPEMRDKPAVPILMDHVAKEGDLSSDPAAALSRAPLRDDPYASNNDWPGDVSDAQADANEDADVGVEDATAALTAEEIDAGRKTDDTIGDASGLFDDPQDAIANTPNEPKGRDLSDDADITFDEIHDAVIAEKAADETVEPTTDALLDNGSALDEDATALARRLARRKAKQKNFLMRKYSLPPKYRMSKHFWPRAWRRAWKRRAAERASMEDDG